MEPVKLSIVNFDALHRNVMEINSKGNKSGRAGKIQTTVMQLRNQLYGLNQMSPESTLGVAKTVALINRHIIIYNRESSKSDQLSTLSLGTTGGDQTRDKSLEELNQRITRSADLDKDEYKPKASSWKVVSNLFSNLFSSIFTKKSKPNPEDGMELQSPRTPTENIKSKKP